MTEDDIDLKAKCQKLIKLTEFLNSVWIVWWLCSRKRHHSLGSVFDDYSLSTSFGFGSYSESKRVLLPGTFPVKQPNALWGAPKKCVLEKSTLFQLLPCLWFCFCISFRNHNQHVLSVFLDFWMGRYWAPFLNEDACNKTRKTELWRCRTKKSSCIELAETLVVEYWSLAT